MRHGKILKAVPEKESMFTLLVVNSKSGEVKILFKLKDVLNALVPLNKQKNGVYCFKEHQNVFRWIFLNYNRHINKECLDFILQFIPEVIEDTFGVTVIPNARVSTKKFKAHFHEKYKNDFHEIFSMEEPDEYEHNPNYYVVKASLNGSVFEETEVFIISKQEYKRWKQKFGEFAPFVVTNVNKIKAS